jgi:hypothetical protein
MLGAQTLPMGEDLPFEQADEDPAGEARPYVLRAVPRVDDEERSDGLDEMQDDEAEMRDDEEEMQDELEEQDELEGQQDEDGDPAPES